MQGLPLVGPQRLSPQRRHDPGTESDDDAAAWATERVDHVVQLLEATGEDTVTCSDYILDYLTGQRAIADIPDELWSTAIKVATQPEALFTFGVYAYNAGRVDDARRAWTVVLDRGLPFEVAPGAAFNLGVLEGKAGEVAAARAAYQVAINSGHPEAASRAADFLRRLGDGL